MTKTFDFVHERNLETIEHVVVFKNKCYEKINILKDAKIELHTEKEKHKPAFDALKKIKMLEKPYQLYLGGYHEMEEERDAYLVALDTLKTIGYVTAVQVGELSKIKSSVENRLSANDAEIRELRKEIRSCNTALELNNHIEEKMQGLEKIDNGYEQERVTAKEMARNLMER